VLKYCVKVEPLTSRITHGYRDCNLAESLSNASMLQPTAFCRI